MSLVPKQLQTQRTEVPPLALMTQASWAPPRPQEALRPQGGSALQPG